MSRSPRSEASPAQHITAAQLFPVAVLALVWGVNWPVLKMGVTEIAPLTFRALTLPFAALGLLAIAMATGDSIRIPRPLWAKVTLLGVANITGWNGLLLFGVQQLPAGRSAIIAFTMPMWSVLFSLALLHEPLSARKAAGLALGMLGMGVLLGDDIRHIQRTPTAALLVLGAAICWALGTVLLRKWKPPLPQKALTGWMMMLGWIPLAALAPFFDGQPLHRLSAAGWFALVYNMFLAGTLAHWAWYSLARTLPVAISSMSSLPVPIVGVFSGMLLLGEHPGTGEWTALALVVAAMVAVLWVPKPAAPAPPPPDN
ncbi:MAG TPA: DMT family transporter [Casimicrobiaceae bacterium]|nr:DMT family transporter [Casimicrobiaceae bacterium]